MPGRGRTSCRVSGQGYALLVAVCGANLDQGRQPVAAEESAAQRRTCQCVCCQNDRRGGPRAALLRPDRLVGPDVTGPEAAIVLAQVLDGFEQFPGARAIADRVEGQNQLARLSDGRPGLVRDTAGAPSRYDELLPPALQVCPARWAADGAAEHGVVPVHRESALVQESARMDRHRMCEPGGGELPVRLRVTDQLSQRQCAPQGHHRAGASREQGTLTDLTSNVARPGDPAEGQLKGDDELDGSPYDRPHHLDLGPVPGDQPAVPHPDGKVGALVAVDALVRDAAGGGLHRPAAVGALVCRAPLEGEPRRVVESA